jgi:hypothetical protein
MKIYGKIIIKEAALELFSSSNYRSELFLNDTVYSSLFLLSFNYKFQSLWRYGLKPALMYERQLLGFVNLFLAFLFSLRLFPLISPSFCITGIDIQGLIRLL